MTVQSDKNKGGFFKPFRIIWEYLCGLNYTFLSKIFVALVVIGIIYAILWSMAQTFWICAVGGVIMFIMLVSDSSPEPMDYLIAFIIGGLISFPIFFFAAPSKTVKDTMDLKPYITNIADNNGSFKLGLKAPFENSINIDFGINSRKYDKLFNTKEFYGDFNITAEKVCEKYRSGTLECKVSLNIDHKYYEAGHLVSVDLTNSVYPKKLDIK